MKLIYRQGILIISIRMSRPDQIGIVRVREANNLITALHPDRDIGKYAYAKDYDCGKKRGHSLCY
jgi:hypothetical protein